VVRSFSFTANGLNTQGTQAGDVLRVTVIAQRAAEAVP